MKSIVLHIAFSFFISLFLLTVLHFAENRIHSDHDSALVIEQDENHNTPDKLFHGNDFFDEDHIHSFENLYVSPERIPVRNSAYCLNKGVLPDLRFWNPPRIS